MFLLRGLHILSFLKVFHFLFQAAPILIGGRQAYVEEKRPGSRGKCCKIFIYQKKKKKVAWKLHWLLTKYDLGSTYSNQNVLAPLCLPPPCPLRKCRLWYERHTWAQVRFISLVHSFEGKIAYWWWYIPSHGSIMLLKFRLLIRGCKTSLKLITYAILEEFLVLQFFV